MRLLPLSVIFTVLMMLSVSCNPEKVDATLSVTPSVTEIKFSADGKTVTAGENPVTPEFTVETNQGKWEVELSEKDSWLKVNKSGNGFTLSADENTAPTEKTPITVTVTAGTADPVKIKVGQSGTEIEEEYLRVTPSVTEMEFSADGKTAIAGENEINPEFTIETNQASWDAVASPSGSWLSVSKSASGFTLSAEENSGADDRGPVTVTVTAGEADPVIITVTQAGKPVVSPIPGAVISMDISGESGYDSNAYFWRDGSATKLSDNARTMGIASLASDVYVIGSVERNSTSHPVFWKNGQVTELPFGSAEGAGTSAITVSGSDVYVVGQEHGSTNAPLIWKNGELFKRVNGIGDFEIYGMAVSGSDVYLAGAEYDLEMDTAGAVYWKNDQKTTLSDQISAAMGVRILGSDVYVGGIVMEEDESFSLGYWKNGEFNAMYASTDYIEPIAMEMSGTDFYMCGYIENEDETIRAAYWKNNTKVELGENAIATGILVDGNDVYVVGMMDKGDREVAVCWKNGELIELDSSTHDTWATGITLLK